MCGCGGRGCIFCVAWLIGFCGGCVVLCIFFFKQKTAYEMRISDWSSDVCSSDLLLQPGQQQGQGQPGQGQQGQGRPGEALGPQGQQEIGRAPCRERVCQYV